MEGVLLCEGRWVPRGSNRRPRKGRSDQRSLTRARQEVALDWSEDLGHVFQPHRTHASHLIVEVVDGVEEEVAHEDPVDDDGAEEDDEAEDARQQLGPAAQQLAAQLRHLGRRVVARAVQAVHAEHAERGVEAQGAHAHDQQQAAQQAGALQAPRHGQQRRAHDGVPHGEDGDDTALLGSLSARLREVRHEHGAVGARLLATQQRGAVQLARG